MGRSKKSVLEKVQEEFPEFCGEVNGLGADQLNSRLANLAKEAERNESAKEDDKELEDAHSLASELSAPYRDVKKAIRLKSKYVIALLKEKGADA